jgi:hypothetical protein
MKKLATLLLVMISLVITPLMAGQCDHAHVTGGGDIATALDVSQNDGENPLKQPGNQAHLQHHCCSHAPALHSNPSSNFDMGMISRAPAVGMWKEARYDSRNVSPLLEPPSHA